ncbi:MEDS domain-containing protein [Candidatus Poribacteria bacterium]
MECRDISYYLCAYLDGELDQDKMGSIVEHLGLCSHCRSELELQQCVKALVNERFSPISAPDHLRNMVMLELGRAEEYRESGIQILDLLRWGTHIAQLYETKNELTELVVPYIETGLEQDELCVWVTAEMSQEEARKALAGNIPDLQRYIDKGQLQILSHEEWFMPDGRFDGQCVLDGGHKKCHEALSSGYEGLRITGNLFWLDQSDWNSFMEFESNLDGIIQDHKSLVVCVYKESKCTIDNIADVMNTHEYVISKMDDSWKLRRLEEM